MQAAIIFRMNGEESRSNANRLAETLRRTGFAPCIIPFFAQWDDGIADVTLLQADLSSAPRFSAYAFRNETGFDLDLIELSAHSYATANPDPDSILLESVWFQHLRGVAIRAGAILKTLNPRIVFVPHGAEVVSRILAEVSTRLGYPILYWESAFWDGAHYVDSVAPHFFSGAAASEKSWALTPAADEATRAFVTSWRQTRASKYPQKSAQAEQAAFNAWLDGGSTPILFIPGQIAFDANVAVNLGSFSDLDALYRAFAAVVPQDWRIIFKHHPKAPHAATFETTAHIFVAHDLDIHDIFTKTDAVFTVSSNVGLEALMAGLPVIVSGRPLYAGRAITQDISTPDDLQRHLQSGVATPNPADVMRFCHHLIRHVLVRDGDTAAMAERIKDASAAPPDKRSPFYSTGIRALISTAQALNRELCANMPLKDAFACLTSAQRDVIIERVSMQALHTHHHGGGAGMPAPPMDAPARSLESVRNALQSALNRTVLLCDLRLEYLYEPADALKQLARSVTGDTSVGLLLHNTAQDPGPAIQRLHPGALAKMARAAGWQAQLFLGVSNAKLDRDPESTPQFLALLARNGELNLASASLKTIMAMPLGYAPWQLGADRFHYRDPVQVLEESVKVSIAGTEGHAVYGPYLHVPAGHWRADFLVQGLGETTELIFDIYSKDLGEVASTVQKVSENTRSISLLFGMIDSARCEFRIAPYHLNERHAIFFRGVTLSSAESGSPNY